MRNNISLTFVIVCGCTMSTTAEPGFLRNRELRQCARFELTECHQHEDRCKVIRRSGKKNLCVDSDIYERCIDFEEEAECWDHLPNCIWNRINSISGNCEDRVRSNLRWCRVDNDCSSGEICASFNFAPDPCIRNGIGQCISQPKQCPSTDEQVCGCDGQDYNNACECLQDGSNVKYEGACSSARDRAFRRYVRDLDNGEFTEEYFWQYMLGSILTDGDTCLTELECYKQSRVRNNEDDFTFRVISDQSNCGCYEHNGKSYWSDHDRCSDQEKMSDELGGSRERTHCDLNSIYRNVRNVPVDTCLTVAGCDEQCENDGRNGVHIKTNPNSNKCGCYRQGNQCYWNSCGNNIDKAATNLPNNYKRVWCGDRTRDARDLVFNTCLTKQDCEDQAELDGDATTPATVKNFNSDNICGCYKKGGNLYWATCGLNGDFYGELKNKKRRVHCRDVQNRSYRVFDRSHSHFHSHPHDIEDHYNYNDELI